MARDIHERLYTLSKDLFIEPNPVPVKMAMALVGGWMPSDVRLPLCEMSPANLVQLRRTLVAMKLTGE